MTQMEHMKEALLETEKIRAIQEELCGFLLNEVVNPVGEIMMDQICITIRTRVQIADPNVELDKLMELNVIFDLRVCTRCLYIILSQIQYYISHTTYFIY